MIPKENKTQEAIHTLKIKITEMENKEVKIESMIQDYKKEAKQLLEKGNKQKAKTILEQATNLKKQLDVHFPS